MNMRSDLVVSITTAALLLSACSSGGGDSAGSEGDLVPPLAGTVADGLAADVDLQTSTTTISANWTGFTDSEGPIAYYEWCIGTTVGGTESQGWISTDTNTSVTNSSLTLQTNVRYYVSVRAFDSASNVSAISTSDGVEINTGTGGPPSGGPLEASSISQWGITWTFDREYPVGQFCNGDWWVVGPVTLVQITPGCQDLNGRTINGSMINPHPTGEVGYDSTLYGQYASGNWSYRPSLNVALNLSTLHPLTLQPSTSLISAISQVGPPSRASWSQLNTAAVLTVLQQAPPADAFRPPYTGNDKTIRFRESQLDYTALGRLIPVSGAPSMQATAAAFERVWLDHCPTWLNRYLHPVENMRDYGRDTSADVGSGALMLNCDFTNSQKRDLLVRMVQVGIDNWANTLNGCFLGGEGGTNSGRKFPILLAGRVLGDPAMLAMGTTYQSGYHGPNHPSNGDYFAEDAQTFYVEQTSPGVYNWGCGGYTAAQAGLPEWGQFHTTWITNDNAIWGADPYRRCCTANSWLGYCLAARIMGLQQAWNHPAFFDYVDRYTQVEPRATWTYAWDGWQGDMWNHFRSQF